MAAGGLDLGISYLKGRVDKTGAHDDLIKSRVKDRPKTIQMFKEDRTHMDTHIKVSIHDTKTRMASVHRSVCLLVFVGRYVYLAGVMVMTACCHQGQRSNGEGE